MKTFPHSALIAILLSSCSGSIQSSIPDRNNNKMGSVYSSDVVVGIDPESGISLSEDLRKGFSRTNISLRDLAVFLDGRHGNNGVIFLSKGWNPRRSGKDSQENVEKVRSIMKKHFDSVRTMVASASGAWELNPVRKGNVIDDYLR